MIRSRQLFFWKEEGPMFTDPKDVLLRIKTPHDQRHPAHPHIINCP